MSKRKLNRRQIWRAEKIQSERSQRALNKQRDLGRQNQSGELSDEQLGLVICRYSKHFEVQALEGDDCGNIHRCVSRANIDSIVAGDKVVWRAGADQSGVIESRHERKNVLERPDNFGKLKTVAANIDQMMIIIAVEPKPQPNLIDRYLVAAELMGIRPVIVLNKADLLKASNRPYIQDLLKLYTGLGYRSLSIVSSGNEDAQLTGIDDIINQRTSIVVGQSGVGKSSLINTLLPDAKLEVGGLSELSREGTHTTTKAKLFHLPFGGQLIDSPGIRDFSLWHINQTQLQQGFIEISDLIVHCRFRDCKHENEPNCAVLNGVEDGLISQQRFDSYLRIKEAIQEQQARGLSLNNSA